MTLRAMLWLYDCGISCCEIKLGEHKTKSAETQIQVLITAYLLVMRDNFAAPQFPLVCNQINGYSPIVEQ